MPVMTATVALGGFSRPRIEHYAEEIQAIVKGWLEAGSLSITDSQALFGSAVEFSRAIKQEIRQPLRLVLAWLDGGVERGFGRAISCGDSRSSVTHRMLGS